MKRFYSPTREEIKRNKTTAAASSIEINYCTDRQTDREERWDGGGAKKLSGTVGAES